MPYTPNVPTAAQFISQSQPLIEQNFVEIQAAFSIDHYPLASAPGVDGKHKWSHYPQQNPSPITALGEIALFSGVGPISGLPELFCQFQNLPAVNPNTLKPWTEFRPSTTGGLDGYFYVAGGRILVKFNRVNPGAAANLDTYVYNGGPAFAVSPSVMLTALSGANPNTFLLSNNLVASTAAQFTFQRRIQNNAVTGASTHEIVFVAIGIPA